MKLHDVEVIRTSGDEPVTIERRRLAVVDGYIYERGTSSTHVKDPTAPHVTGKALIEYRNAEASALFVKAYAQASNCEPVDWLRVAANMNDLLRGANVDDSE